MLSVEGNDTLGRVWPPATMSASGLLFAVLVMVTGPVSFDPNALRQGHQHGEVVYEKNVDVTNLSKPVTMEAGGLPERYGSTPDARACVAEFHDVTFGCTVPVVANLLATSAGSMTHDFLPTDVETALRTTIVLNVLADFARFGLPRSSGALAGTSIWLRRAYEWMLGAGFKGLRRTRRGLPAAVSVSQATAPFMWARAIPVAVCFVALAALSVGRAGAFVAGTAAGYVALLIKHSLGFEVAGFIFDLMLAYPGLVFLAVWLWQVRPCGAVVCLSCHDGIPGCEGGAACPFYTGPFINSEILSADSGSHSVAGLDGAEATVYTMITCTALLPRKIARFLTRGVLDFFKTVARRGPAQTAVDVTTLTTTELLAAVNAGRVEASDAMASVLTRIGESTSQAETARLNAISSALANVDRMGTHAAAVGASRSNGELLGAFTFAWAQAGKTVQNQSASLAVAGTASDESASERKVILTAKVVRPRSESEFHHMLMVWSMICHATGLANILTTGAFILLVVHDQVRTLGLTWQQAHELFLVYLEAVETAPAGQGLTLANVYMSGGQDTYREQALQRAKTEFGKAVCLPCGDGGDGGGGAGKGIFRGQHTRNGRPCVTFNLGKSEHPASVLDANGRCKFAHKCDKWVTEQPDGTKGGICGSFKHARVNCDNPKRTDEKVA